MLRILISHMGVLGFHALLWLLTPAPCQRAPWEALVVAHTPGIWPSMWETWIAFQAPSSGPVQSQLSQNLGSEATDEEVGKETQRRWGEATAKAQMLTGCSHTCSRETCEGWKSRRPTGPHPAQHCPSTPSSPASSSASHRSPAHLLAHVLPSLRSTCPSGH